jgi:hypothetical protein
MKPSYLSRLPLVDIPAGGAVVCVEVPASSAAMFRPGTRLLFARKSADGKNPEVLPGHRGHGDIVIVAIGSSDKATHRLLTVAVPSLPDAQSLAETGWQPIALGPPLLGPPALRGWGSALRRWLRDTADR